MYPSTASSLKCTRSLLNPSFESYKLQLLDSAVGGSLLLNSFILPNATNFDLASGNLARQNLSYSELKWLTKHNHAQLKLSFGPVEAVISIDAELNVSCTTCSCEGKITNTILTTLKDDSFTGEFLTFPTIKLLSADDSKASLIAFSGRDKAFVIDAFHNLTAEITHCFTLPPVFSPGSQEVWTLMDVLSDTQSGAKLVCCVKIFSPEKSFAVAVLGVSGRDCTLICNVPGKEFPLVSKMVSNGTDFYIASKKLFGGVSGDEAKAPTPQTDLPYTWLQTNDDLTVHFSLKNAVKATEINCLLKDHSLVLEEPGSANAPLNQNWFGKINSSESLWTIEDGRWLTLHLEKSDKGTRWSNLFEFDDGVMEALDPNELAEIRESLDKYSGDPKPRYSLQQPFGSEIEQEDFEGEEFGLSLYDTAGRYKHTISSGGMSWLGESLSEPGSSASSFFLRYDVDALVFANQPPFEHSSSFDAIGYVQASKKNCKFMALSSDQRLMLIVESSVNIYLYGKPSSSIRQAPQAVVQLPTDSPIQGVQLMYNRILLVLTQTGIFTFDLRPFISRD